jgi:hypothetical protein
VEYDCDKFGFMKSDKLYLHLDAFLNCGLNLFHDLIEEGKKEFANNCNLVSGFLNSVWTEKDHILVNIVEN